MQFSGKVSNEGAEVNLGEWHAQVGNKPRVSKTELTVCLVAITIFSAAAIALIIAAPFTAAVLAVPGLVCALTALGVGAYLGYKFNKPEVDNLLKDVKKSASDRVEKKEFMAQRKADRKEQEARTSKTDAARSQYSATASKMQTKYFSNGRPS